MAEIHITRATIADLKPLETLVYKHYSALSAGVNTVVTPSPPPSRDEQTSFL
jgi:hypothetical protein